MLLRLSYLGVTNVFAVLRLLPVSDRDKDVEILALRHQITVLERQLGKARPRFSLADWAFLAALLHRLPRDVLGRFRLLVRPETVLRWHRGLLARHHAARSRPGRPGRPRTVRSVRLLVPRLSRENPMSRPVTRLCGSGGDDPLATPIPARGCPPRPSPTHPGPGRGRRLCHPWLRRRTMAGGSAGIA